MRQSVVSLISVLLLLTVSNLTLAQSDFAQANNPFNSEAEFLPVEQAFSPEVRGDQTLTVSFNIQPGYYLYKHQFNVTPADALAQPMNFPDSEAHVDEFFGETQIFRDYLEFEVKLNRDYQGQSVQIQYQGCADAGLCYPPTWIELNAGNVQQSATSASSPATTTSPSTGLFGLEQQSVLVSLALFFALGIGLAFTPCVFPMYPILSSVVIGDKPRTFKNALWLSFIYVQGMAITYSLLGLVVALAGMQYQAYFQHPAVLIVLSVAFALFALSMLGLYTLQLPASWQNKLQTISGQQKGGSITGVFIIGMISGLVASPCTTAPLSGALLYIAQSGDIAAGAAILYALSLGMGVPLIIFGVSGGKLLPKAGAWMQVIKHGFGWLLLAVVVVLVERLLATQQAFWLWISYFAAMAVFMGQHLLTLSRWLARGLLFIVLVGSIVAGTYWQIDKLERAEQAHQLFTQVETLAQIDQQVAAASEAGQWVMVDLYADWCVACKEFEQYTFAEATVQAELTTMQLLQANVTANDAIDQEVLEQYQVLGLPTVLFFNPQGEEMTQWRVTGFKDAEAFVQHLQTMKATQ